jgi:hypothetical protein
MNAQTPTDWAIELGLTQSNIEVLTNPLVQAIPLIKAITFMRQ